MTNRFAEFRNQIFSGFQEITITTKCHNNLFVYDDDDDDNPIGDISLGGI